MKYTLYEGPMDGEETELPSGNPPYIMIVVWGAVSSDVFDDNYPQLNAIPVARYRRMTWTPDGVTVLYRYVYDGMDR